MGEISNEALYKEIQGTIVESQRQLDLTRAQIAARQREKKMLVLTLNELTALPGNVSVYQGVGKIFVKDDLGTAKTSLAQATEKTDDEMQTLLKRRTYLETTLSNANDHMVNIKSR